MADARSVPDSDLAPLGRKLPDGIVQEGAAGLHGKGSRHEWWWLSEQTPEEVMLVKFWDSTVEEGVAVRCLHTSVDVPGTEHEATRESIEIRAIVCW